MSGINDSNLVVFVRLAGLQKASSSATKDLGEQRRRVMGKSCMIYPKPHMRNEAYVLVCFLAIGRLSAFQAGAPAWQRSALGRPGLHHRDIMGRFLSPEGRPVEGVRAQLESGGVRDLPIAEAVSGADGGFRFADVQSANSGCGGIPLKNG